jgi:hypothetical protein
MENTKISAALVAAQKAFGPALKTSINPHYKSKYCSLDACIEAVIDGLHANGIALIQRPQPCESGVMIETLFVHESGESLSGGTLHVPAQKNDPQGYGSALTYARRYSLCAACGIAPEDDDGNAASKPAKAKATPAPAADVFTLTESVTITSVTEREGETNGKKWKAYFIEAGGKKCGTFSGTLASQATDAKDNGDKVNITTKPGRTPDSLELVSITPSTK